MVPWYGAATRSATLVPGFTTNVWTWMMPQPQDHVMTAPVLSV